jgi:hypothetical protein
MCASMAKFACAAREASFTGGRGRSRRLRSLPWFWAPFAPPGAPGFANQVSVYAEPRKSLASALLLGKE